jgi:hypothetical protein
MIALAWNPSTTDKTRAVDRYQPDLLREVAPKYVYTDENGHVVLVDDLVTREGWQALVDRNGARQIPSPLRTRKV